MPEDDANNVPSSVKLDVKTDTSLFHPKVGISAGILLCTAFMAHVDFIINTLPKMTLKATPDAVHAIIESDKCDSLMQKARTLYTEFGFSVYGHGSLKGKTMKAICTNDVAGTLNPGFKLD